MIENTDVRYEVMYTDSENGMDYMTTDSMDLATATEKLKEYSKKHKNCRLLETKVITKEIYLT